MSAADENLNPQQEAAIVALLTEKNIADAAAKVGVHERTVRRWLKEDATFQEALRVARRQVTEVGIARLQGLVADAVEALRRNLTCSRPPAEIRAAHVILTQAVQAVELADVLARLDSLEAIVKARNHEHSGKAAGAVGGNGCRGD